MDNTVTPNDVDWLAQCSSFSDTNEGYLSQNEAMKCQPKNEKRVNNKARGKFQHLRQKNLGRK
jgi:hypothetical protein